MASHRLANTANTANKRVCWRVVVFGFAVTCANTGCESRPTTTAQSQTVRETNESEVLRRWMALGNGCRAQWNEPGNVSAHAADDAALERPWTVFDLAAFAHESKAGQPSHQSYAWDCKIRFAVEPPANRRLHALVATTEIYSAKSERARLRFAAMLSVDGKTVDETAADWPQGVSAARRQPISLAGAEQLFSRRLACGEATMAGFDYVWSVALEDLDRDRVSTRVAGSGTLRVEALLEPCQTPQVATARR